MARVVFRPKAHEDLIELWRYLAVESGVSIADRVIDRIEARTSMLADHPEMAPLRLEIAGGARGLVVERWLVLYFTDGDVVDVVRVVDGARDLRRLRFNE